MNWTTAISGNVKSAVHSVANPNEAPAMTQVPTPEGSSSEAPVMKPGPSSFHRRTILVWFRQPATVLLVCNGETATRDSQLHLGFHPPCNQGIIMPRYRMPVSSLIESV